MRTYIVELKRKITDRFKKKPLSNLHFKQTIIIKDNHDKIVCNISDFIDWCESLKILNKCTIDKISDCSDFFIAYHSYISIMGKEDNLDYRKEWFDHNKNKIIIRTLRSGGLAV